MSIKNLKVFPLFALCSKYGSEELVNLKNGLLPNPGTDLRVNCEFPRSLPVPYLIGRQCNPRVFDHIVHLGSAFPHSIVAQGLLSPVSCG